LATPYPRQHVADRNSEAYPSFPGKPTPASRTYPLFRLHGASFFGYTSDLSTIERPTAMHTPLRYFEYAHLPDHLRPVSAPFERLADDLDACLADGPEKDAALRKLLEAKDCAVRAAVDAHARDRHLQSVHRDAGGAA